MRLKKIIKFSAVCFLTYFAVELVCFIFLQIKFSAAHFPTFRYSYTYAKYDFPIAEINPAWGTWHYSDTYIENKQCFQSIYHINSHGARDKERNLQSDSNRIVFLGDSFIEGYGLLEDERLTNRLESVSNREVLNFGCGYFTPTQEYLVYKHLAKKFSHNTVIIGILPFNDLAEDDTSFREKDPFIHYQPFFQKDSGNYRLMYREDRLSKSTFNKAGYFALQNTFKARVTRFLKEFSFWFNIYQAVSSQRIQHNKSGEAYSGYYDYTTPQLEKLKFILTQLHQEAEGKRCIVTLLPVYNDFIRFRKHNQPGLSKELKLFCKEKGMECIDLLPELNKRVKDPASLYFSCDGHWNAAANKMAAEILLPLAGK